MMSRVALCAIGFAWTVLGGRRGLQEDDYKQKQKVDDMNKRLEEYRAKDPIYWGREVKRLEKEVQSVSRPPLYVDRVGDAVWGGLVYLNPLMLPVTVPKELYRMEVNLRGLEEERKTDRYNKLYW